MKKRVLSIFMLVCMLLTAIMLSGAVPTTALAAVTFNYDRFESYNYPGNFVRNLNGRAHMDLDVNITPFSDSEWKTVPGLADPACISFESVTMPGYFLRHQNSDIYLHQNDGTTLFKQDATFKTVVGLKDLNYISFQSYNYPNCYIRHYNGYLRIDPIPSSTAPNYDLFKQDATFRKQTLINNTSYKKVMPLGDSITDGWNVPGGYRIQLWNKIINNGLLADFVGSQFNGPSSIGDNNHEGHPGWRIDQIDAQINGWMDTYAPQIVLLHIGTNDMNQQYAPGAPAKLSILIDKICAKLPAGGKVYVAKIIPSADATQNQLMINFNSQIPGIVQTKVNEGKPVYMVDMYSALTTADLADTLHPNATGYAKMGNVWYNAIQGDLLNGGAGTNLSKGKTASASSYVGADAAAKAVDGDSTTRWTANGSAKPQWIMVDLGQNRNITRILTQFEFGNRYYQYKIEYSTDNVNWSTYVDRTTNTNVENIYIDYNNVSARYVRLTTTGTQNSGDWAAIYEFQVYGS